MKLLKITVFSCKCSFLVIFMSMTYPNQGTFILPRWSSFQYKTFKNWMFLKIFNQSLFLNLLKWITTNYIQFTDVPYVTKLCSSFWWSCTSLRPHRLLQIRTHYSSYQMVGKDPWIHILLQQFSCPPFLGIPNNHPRNEGTSFQLYWQQYIQKIYISQLAYSPPQFHFNSLNCSAKSGFLSK